MPKRLVRIELLAGASVLAAAVSCASNTQSGGDLFGTFGDDSGGQSSGGTSSGGSSSGSMGTTSGSSSGSGGQSSGGTSGGSSGSSGGGSSSGASLDGGSGASSSSSGGLAPDGSIAPSKGCGQATSCTPGSDLAPPATADGFQIAYPSSISIQPGQESYYCYDKVVPGGQAINVGAFQSWMTSGASHHFITYIGSGTDGALTGGAANTLAACNPSGNWVYATSTSGQVIELKFPDGVGLPLAANQILILNVHFLNPGSTAITPQVKLNVLYAKNVQYAAQAMVSFNAGISVPPGGSQTVRGSCTPPVGSKFFAYTTHAHKHATELDVNYVSSGVTTNIVKSTQWDNPDVALWNGPNFLTIKSGDQLTYSCSYTNTSTGTITVGETAAYNEMCMSIGYFFPATGVGGGLGSTYCN